MSADYKNIDISELKRLHTPGAIKKRLAEGPSNNYLKDFIYGSIDGIVTTFAIVAGVYGASLSSGVIIILGIANLIADGFSMGISNYLGTKADKELMENAKQEELNHIKHYPEGEKEEIRQIFANKGFEGQELDDAVNIITSDINRWVETMMKEELGYSLKILSPFNSGATTFGAFILVGFIPLAAFVINWFIPGLISNPFFVSSVLTGIAFFLVGAFKSRFIGKSWYVSGLEVLFVGSIAAVIAYIIGHLLKSLV